MRNDRKGPTEYELAVQLRDGTRKAIEEGAGLGKNLETLWQSYDHFVGMVCEAEKRRVMQLSLPLNLGNGQGVRQTYWILNVVSNETGISLASILSRNKKASIAEARAQSAYLSREITNLSFPMIAHILNRVHPTAFNNWQGVKNQMEIDENYRGLVERLKAESLAVINGIATPTETAQTL